MSPKTTPSTRKAAPPPEGRTCTYDVSHHQDYNFQTAWERNKIVVPLRPLHASLVALVADAPATARNLRRYVVDLAVSETARDDGTPASLPERVAWMEAAHGPDAALVVFLDALFTLGRERGLKRFRDAAYPTPDATLLARMQEIHADSWLCDELVALALASLRILEAPWSKARAEAFSFLTDEYDDGCSVCSNWCTDTTPQRDRSRRYVFCTDCHGTGVFGVRGEDLYLMLERVGRLHQTPAEAARETADGGPVPASHFLQAYEAQFGGVSEWPDPIPCINHNCHNGMEPCWECNEDARYAEWDDDSEVLNVLDLQLDARRAMRDGSVRYGFDGNDFMRSASRRIERDLATARREARAARRTP